MGSRSDGEPSEHRQSITAMRHAARVQAPTCPRSTLARAFCCMAGLHDRDSDLRRFSAFRCRDNSEQNIYTQLIACDETLIP
eukprot:461069-Pyramimonas_sp.AAC.1